MQQRKRKIRIRKLWGFCFLFITISILTFVCRTCVLVKATGTGVTSTEGSTAEESDKQTNPTENDSNAIADSDYVSSIDFDYGDFFY